MAMIEKPTIIITSLGRTGTLFFSEFFREIIEDSSVFHEPDVINFYQYKGLGQKIRNLRKQINDVGINFLIIRRLQGKGSLISLSDARLTSKLEYFDAVSKVLEQRMLFVESQPGKIYIESNAGYYGLIDVLKNVYKQQCVVYIIRNGYTWVQSKMNWGLMYNKGWLRSLLAHTWPTARDMYWNEYREKWSYMNLFEKICWAWRTLNQYALDSINSNPNVITIKFEDIFLSENAIQNLSELLKSISCSLMIPIDYSDVDIEPWLGQKIHASDKEFPDYAEWSISNRKSFNEICGPLMEKMGYRVE